MITKGPVTRPPFNTSIAIVPYSLLQLHFATNIVSADHSPGPFREQGQLGLKAALTTVRSLRALLAGSPIAQLQVVQRTMLSIMDQLRWMELGVLMAQQVEELVVDSESKRGISRAGDSLFE